MGESYLLYCARCDRYIIPRKHHLKKPKDRAKGMHRCSVCGTTRLSKVNPNKAFPRINMPPMDIKRQGTKIGAAQRTRLKIRPEIITAWLSGPNHMPELKRRNLKTKENMEWLTRRFKMPPSRAAAIIEHLEIEYPPIPHEVKVLEEMDLGY